ncbi:hypothetical protein ABB37_01261 [Leptomonas pyrrhocoris]|uniref:Uncharacterized protein n=1 Tax=Leptomonas pyrrhocoris TaxID=157538 RepID=A0A0M9G8N5_LEPPY|nr:hypothetical protein ABB37_01261 [Leptomonas pyrrhocoris]XP_015663216.1 hypothetical protein ABB37_01261 [Leptomonas pyrrhocoris]KPA84776.1 hypothetical protein ABB37_01261 [Leptomonas pyrrhocoris]KPA84777.1 hypothetical protein ABB37_01261 [Leptomonas pyrrhocoris]|eukprot:XP_015663215.1 hypothetical protein ABB37_01261 [Leptomonas pyrrhocoris]
MSSAGAGVAGGNASAAAYTGAAILSTYTNRRKVLQEASALSSHMQKQVEEVVEMAEEQRLLSQAFRSRHKIAEQEYAEAHAPQTQRKKQQQHQQATEAVSSASASNSAPGSSPSPDELLLPVGGADGSAAAVGGTDGGGRLSRTLESGMADGYGVVLEGAPDTKRLLQQQMLDKSEILGKMRGMQLAIQELSAEAIAEEEPWFACSRFTSDAAVTANTDDPTEAAEEKGGSDDVLTPAKNVPQDVLSKLDAIRDLRMALKDMLDARRPHATVCTSYGGTGAGVGLGGVPGAVNTWIEQDAMYTPPAPSQVFSTSALAVTLEYMSDSMASIARLADEFCVATTFRARTERIVLLPHLRSLAKWTAQAERCLDTAQRHLRHFLVGEAAVLEGGSFEVNSLQEQTLMLKESLTAQDQKVKSMTEAMAAVLHRLREVRQRCRMWELYLLHRQSESGRVDKSLKSPLLSSLERARGNRSVTSPNTQSNSDLAVRTSHSSDGAVTTSTFGKTGIHTSGDAAFSSLLVHGGRGTESYTHDKALQQSARAWDAEGNDASPLRRVPPPSILKDFLPSQSAAAAAAAYTAPPGTMWARSTTSPPSPSTMDRMERRIAQSWGNPYVRKRLLRQSADAAGALPNAQEQLVQQQLHGGTVHSSLTPFPVQRSGEGMHFNGLALPHSASPIDGSLHKRNSFDRSWATPSGDGLSADFHSPDLLHFPSQLQLDGSSPIAPYHTASGNASRPFPHCSQSAPQRRSQVTVSPLQSSFPGAGEGGDRHRISRAFCSITTAINGLVGVEEADITELADVRTLQLLQSLLRSVPLTSVQPRPGWDAKDGNDAHATAEPAVVDVMSSDVTRELCRHSIQRLLQFFKAQTRPPNQNQLFSP